MANNYPSILVILSALFIVNLCLTTALNSGGEEEEGGSFPVPVPARHGTAVKKDERWSVVTTEFGEISAVKVSDGKDGSYHLQFITMEPNSLFLPVHLHSDMVFYVDSGSGTLSWVDTKKDSDKIRQVQLQTGDVYRLRTGSFFYLQSHLESDRRKLRIYAIFSDSKDELREGRSFGAYASVRDLVLGFDNKVLQAALNVDEGVIEELKSGERQAMIVHGVAKGKDVLEVHYRIIRAFLGRTNYGLLDVDTNDKDKAYNILNAKHDVENPNGWSLIVTHKQLKALKDSDFGVFLVNLTKGAVMGPHWNPMAAEIAVVLRGRGMAHVVCPSTSNENERECKNLRFRVEEGDVFVVPRYHPMAQMSFNNESFVFMGFTTTTKKNHPQYLVGKASVLQALDKRVLAASFGVSNTTMDQVLSAQKEAIIVKCESCAEEEEMERQKEEEEEKRREEEERKKEEEEAARKKEEEEAKRREEEKRKKEEEEEEEAKRQEEEEAREREQEEEAAAAREQQREKEEAEAARRQQEEEAAKERHREQEEAAARERQREEEEAAAAREQQREEEESAAATRERQREEEAARQEEEAAARRRQEEEAAARRRQEEEAAARRRQEEEAAARRRQEEEAAARRREEQEEEAAARRQEEEAARKQQEEADARRQQQEEEEETARRQEEAEAREQEEEATARSQEEAAAARGQEVEKEQRQREQEEAAAGTQREEEGRREQGERGEGEGEREGEAASREEEERARRSREQEQHGRQGSFNV